MGAATRKTPPPGKYRLRGESEVDTRDKNKRVRFAPADGIIVLLAVIAILLSSLGAADAAGEPRVVISNGTDEWVYPLEQERIVEVPGPLGVSIVHIHDGTARMEKSPCYNQTCVAMGGISEPDQWIACLPNQVFIRIEGGADHDGVDTGTW